MKLQSIIILCWKKRRYRRVRNRLETREGAQKYEEKGGRENRMLETGKRKRIQQKMKMEIKKESGTVYMRNGMTVEEVKEVRTERIKKYCLKNRR